MGRIKDCDKWCHIPGPYGGSCGADILVQHHLVPPRVRAVGCKVLQSRPMTEDVDQAHFFVSSLSARLP